MYRKWEYLYMTTLKRTSVLIILLVLYIVPSIDGLYIPPTRTIICSDHSVCLHEIGHALDHRMGWVSKYQEWREAVIMYVGVHAVSGLQPCDMGLQIILYPYQSYKESVFTRDLPLTELYANIYQWAEGDPDLVPEQFRAFYDWQEADRLRVYYGVN